MTVNTIYQYHKHHPEYENHSLNKIHRKISLQIRFTKKPMLLGKTRLQLETLILSPGHSISLMVIFIIILVLWAKSCNEALLGHWQFCKTELTGRRENEKYVNMEQSKDLAAAIIWFCGSESTVNFSSGMVNMKL